MPSLSTPSPALSEKLARFDRLPDDAIVDDHVAAALLGISVYSLRRTNPVPLRRITERRGGRRAGDLREKVRESAA